MTQAGDIFGETSRDIPMPITYRLDHARRIIVETWSGAVNEAELATHWRGYLADPDVMHCRRTLVDLREAEIAFTGSELAGLVHRIVAPVLGDRKWVSAILVASPLQYGQSRQYQVFAESYSTDAIFQDWQAAEEWLLEQHT